MDQNFLNYLIYFCAVILPYLLVVGLIVYFFIAQDKRRAWRLITLSFFSAILAWFLTSLFKYNWPSPRPFEVIANLKPLVITGYGDSFPSNHATFFGALAISIFLQNKKLGLIFIAGAIIISIARVLANIHWLIDVITGLSLGALVAIVVWLVYHWVYPK